MFEDAEVVKEGIWKYSGSIECKVRIIKWHTLYGSGDYEDSAEISDDRDVECYYVLMESLMKKGEFPVIRGGFLSLEEAIEDAEVSIYNEITWIK